MYCDFLPTPRGERESSEVKLSTTFKANLSRVEFHECARSDETYRERTGVYETLTGVPESSRKVTRESPRCLKLRAARKSKQATRKREFEILSTDA